MPGVIGTGCYFHQIKRKQRFRAAVFQIPNNANPCSLAVILQQMFGNI